MMRTVVGLLWEAAGFHVEDLDHYSDAFVRAVPGGGEIIVGVDLGGGSRLPVSVDEPVTVEMRDGANLGTWKVERCRTSFEALEMVSREMQRAVLGGAR